MKDVYLYGELGKRFGKKWRFSISTPNEAFRAIHANTDGFIEYLNEKSKEGVQYVIAFKDVKKMHEAGCDDDEIRSACLSEEDLGRKMGANTELYIMPAVKGSGADPWTLAWIMEKVLIMIVTAVIVGGIMKMLFKPPKKNEPTTTKSYLFSGGKNVERQGKPVPVGYGRMRVGSLVVGSEKNSYAIEDSSTVSQNKSADVLQSYSEFVYTDLLCEGPIEGFCNMHGGPIQQDEEGILQGIFFNEVPVKNSDSNGTLNYILNEKNTLPSFKKGEVGEGVMRGNKSISTTVDYATELYGAAPYYEKAGRDPIPHHDSVQSAINEGAKIFTHAISNHNATEVTLHLRTIVFFQSDDGNTFKDKVRFAARLNINGSYINLLDNESTSTASEKDIEDGSRYKTESDGGGLVSSSDTVGETQLTYLMGASKRPFDYRYGSSRGLTSVLGKNGYFEIGGIATDGYEFDISFSLPRSVFDGEGSVQIQVIKLSSQMDPTAKSSSSGQLGGINIRRELNVASVTQSLGYQLRFPHSAIAQVTFDSKNFSQIPERSYHLKMKRVLVPSNYNPVTRKYDGPWNGLFKGQASAEQSIHSIDESNLMWTDNPAWIFYDLCNNTRYGLGKFGLQEANIDKWQLYKISKYCDELVETGYPDEFSRRSFTTSNSESHEDRPVEVSAAMGITLGPLVVKENIDNGRLLYQVGGIYKWFEPGTRVVDENGNFLFIAKDKEGGTGRIKVTDADESEKSTSISFFDLDLSGNSEYDGASGLIRFKHEFGDDKENAGKKVAIFIENASTGYGAVTVDTQERYIIKTIAASRIVRVRAPSFLNHSSNTGGETSGKVILQSSHALVEPRFSANFIISDRVQAFNILNHLASIFRGIVGYTNGQVIALQDSFKRPIQLFNSSNVDKAGFNYSGTVKNKRFSAVMVRYNNKDNNFSPSVAYLEDADAVQKFGYVEEDTIGYGCTSPSQAQRLAKWILHSSQLESETVVFKTGAEASYLFPGSIFEVSDEVRAGAFRSGRLLAVHPMIKDSSGNFIEVSEVQIDKDLSKTPHVRRVELSVAAGNANVDSAFVSMRAPFEFSDDDQDAEIDSIKEPQVIYFDGRVSFVDNHQAGPKGQACAITDLRIKKPLMVDKEGFSIKCYNHNMQNGDRVRFLTEGLHLPYPLNRYRSGDLAYFVVNRTKHTFQVSLSEGGDAIAISGEGKDEYGNSGGSHFFAPEKFQYTKEAVEKVMIGAVWSIKGRVGVAASTRPLTSAQQTAMHVSEDGFSHIGWYRTDWIGWIHNTHGTVTEEGTSLPAYSFTTSFHLGPYLNTAADDGKVGGLPAGGGEWIFFDHLHNPKPAYSGMWFFIEGVGWIWTDNSIRTTFWYIQGSDGMDGVNQAPTTATGWIYIDYSEARSYISRIFVYDSDSSYYGSFGDVPINDNVMYKIGDRKLNVIKKVEHPSSPGTTLGYWLATKMYGRPDPENRTAPSTVPSKPTATDDNKTDYTNNVAVIGMSATTAVNSLQGKNCIRLSFGGGAPHALGEDGTIVIKDMTCDNVNGLLDEITGSGQKRWPYLIVSDLEIELLDSSAAYDAKVAGDNFTSGYINRHLFPDKTMERKMQGVMYRTISIKELDDGGYEVSGLEYNSAKFKSIDEKTIIKKPVLPIPPQEDMTVPEPPNSLILSDLTKGL